MRISHKQLLHLKSRSSLGWCHSDDSVTHGPRRREGQRDGQRSCWASQMLWGLACLQPPHLAAGALRKKNHRPWKVGQEAGNWGPALHLPGLSGGPMEFSSLLQDQFVCTMRGWIRWSLGFFPALRTQQFSGRRGCGLEAWAPRLSELVVLPPCSHAIWVLLGPGHRLSGLTLCWHLCGKSLGVSQLKGFSDS